MSEITCPRCGRLNPPTLTKCKYCMKQLTPSTSHSSSTVAKKPPPPPISLPSHPTLPAPSKSGHSGGTIIPTPPSPPLTSKPPFSPSPFGKPLLSPPSPLPSKFIKLGPPTIEGEVKDTREIQVDKKDFGKAIVDGICNLLLLPVSPTVAVTTIVAGRYRPLDKVIIYIVRIERPDGSMGQAQIDGEFIGGVMERGDYVSIWGIERNGVVSLKRAYNHTISAEIKVR